MNSPKCLFNLLFRTINCFLSFSLYLFSGIGIDLGTTYTRVFAPVKTFYNSRLTDHQFDVLCAIHPDGRSIETKVVENPDNVLIGKSAVGKNVLSGFKNSITNPQSQKNARMFVNRLLQMIERLDIGPRNVSPNAEFVFDCFLFFNSISFFL